MKKEEKKPLINTFSKLIVFICLIFGMVLTAVSYYFAYIGVEPLIDLSTVLITTVISPVLTFIIENAFCDIFQHNKLSFSTPISRLEQEDMMNQTNDIEMGDEDNAV